MKCLEIYMYHLFQIEHSLLTKYFLTVTATKTQPALPRTLNTEPNIMRASPTANA